MIGFKQFIESKGIRLTPELEEKIDALVPQALQAAIQSKQTGETVDLGSMDYTSQYFKDRNVHVDLEVINDPDQDMHGDYNAVMGVRINVAHANIEDINARWIRRLLVHEIGIHSQDPKRSDFNVFSKMGAKSAVNTGGVDYYKQSHEFDAYTGQIADSIIKLAKINPQGAAPMLNDTLKFIQNPEASKNNKIYGIIGDPDYWKTFHMYYLHAGPNQKRRMQQRIYKAVMDAKAIIAQGSRNPLS